jgi:hypothetical protein
MAGPCSKACQLGHRHDRPARRRPNTARPRGAGQNARNTIESRDVCDRVCGFIGVVAVDGREGFDSTARMPPTAAIRSWMLLSPAPFGVPLGSNPVRLPPAWSMARRGLIEQQLAPDTSGAEVLPDSPCLAELVDEQQAEAAWGFGVRREQARCKA